MIGFLTKSLAIISKRPFNNAVDWYSYLVNKGQGCGWHFEPHHHRHVWAHSRLQHCDRIIVAFESLGSAPLGAIFKECSLTWSCFVAALKCSFPMAMSTRTLETYWQSLTRIGRQHTNGSASVISLLAYRTTIYIRVFSV